MKVLKEGLGCNIEQVCTGKGNGDGGCGTTLLVEKDDIYMTWHTDLLYYYTSKCPCCGIETDIPSNKLPSSVMRIANEKRLSLRNS